MNKLSYIFTLLAVALGLSSCETDRDPVFTPATSASFEMLTPVFADQFYELSADGTLILTCKSQPSYGAPIAPITYGVEVSLTGEFNDAVLDAEGEVVTPATYVEVKANNTNSVMTISEKKLTQAYCKLKGYTEDDEGKVAFDVVPLYFRGMCMPATPDTEFNLANRVVSSNIISLNKVLPYFSLAQPGYIYLVGQPAGWAPPMEDNADVYEKWKLYEKADEIESKIYYGQFEINAGDAMFRFYTALTGWDSDSYGSQADDNPVSCNYEDKEFGLVKGKGSYDFSTWPGGLMYLRVNMNDMTVTVSQTEIKDE